MSAQHILVVNDSRSFSVCANMWISTSFSAVVGGPAERVLFNGPGGREDSFLHHCVQSRLDGAEL